jgi:copper oxidase (laccase) domain-containing protein
MEPIQNSIFTTDISPQISISLSGKPHNWAGYTHTWNFVHDNEHPRRPNEVFCPTLGGSADLIHTDITWAQSQLNAHGVTIYNNTKADAISINRRAGIIMKPADCPILVIYTSTKAVIAHCGRDNIFDRELILGKKPRSKRSVIISAMEKFAKPGKELVKAWVSFGISPEHFVHDPNHPEHGEYNQGLINHISTLYGNEYFHGNPWDGKIDLQKLVVRQLTEAGVLIENIQSVPYCTFSNEQSWSHRRETQRGNVSGRNLVYIEVNLN